MQISVGTTLKYKGADYVCTHVSQNKATEFARRDSVVLHQEQTSIDNVKHQDLQVDEFSEGDIISFDYIRIELTSPGRNVVYIYPHYYVRKEALDGQQGAERSGEAPDSQTEGARQGAESGQSSGGQSAGKDGSSVDSDG